MKWFGLWTWIVFIPLMLAACVIAAVLLFVTMSVEVFLSTIALGLGFVLFVWLMPWTFPALEETVREHLKRRYGA
jgi:ABC-type transport system involved in cytochrome bd biosynthesis fused ATPase/permease subunit